MFPLLLVALAGVQIRPMGPEAPAREPQMAVGVNYPCDRIVGLCTILLIAG
jgi:hypothetical protein